MATTKMEPACYSRAWYLRALRAKVLATKKQNRKMRVDLLRLDGKAGPVFVILTSVKMRRAAGTTGLREAVNADFLFATEAEGWAYFHHDDDRAVAGLPRRAQRLLGISN